MIRSTCILILSSLILISLSPPTDAIGLRRSINDVTDINEQKNHRILEEEGGLLGDFIDNILGDDDEGQDDVIDDNEEDEEEEETDGIFGDGGILDGGILDGILDGINENNETDDGQTDEMEWNLTSIVQNITDGLQNITEGLLENWNITYNDTADGIFDIDWNITNILENFTDSIFGDGDFNFTDGIFGDGNFNFTDNGWLFPTWNGSFVELFNETKKASVILSPVFMEEWMDDVVFDDTVCEAATNEPECFNSTGDVGFWICRTLSNPFTGAPQSESICVGEGEYLPNNDECGCCGSECPEMVCTCPCDLSSSISSVFDDDDDGDNNSTTTASTAGVLITMETVFGGKITNCVDPRYAVSVVGMSNKITCDESCND